MADYNNSFDCSASDLLCNEETKGFFLDDDDDLVQAQPFSDQSCRSNGGDSEVSLNLPCLSEQCIWWMVEREREHLPRDDYLDRLKTGDLDVSFRKWALHWMLKACAHHNYGETCLYTAMTYFDRFLSVYEFPICSLGGGDRKWVTQLISVACLSLAAKIEEVNVPTTLAFQAGEPKFLFEGKTIQRMEFLILNRLDWKIKAYTPFNFVDFYLRKMNNGEGPSWKTIINRSLDVIISTIEGIEFLKFRPSEIGAAVAVFVSEEVQSKDIDKSLYGLVGIDKCLELIKNLATISGMIKGDYRNLSNGSILSSSLSLSLEAHSPNGVLEAACLSCTTVESCPSSSHTTPQPKRRKLQ
ncbi:cyclin d2 family protein [Striga asiatica]|uniref:Cyclin d2 family protein n=1 Tax=Striga asiatica TaxID=4170 RepID=A0A5A7PNW2_STRAF|nr:cyclin d2 family protein [Striga asiatica]